MVKVSSQNINSNKSIFFQHCKLFCLFLCIKPGNQTNSLRKNWIARKYFHIYVEGFASGNFDSITHNRDAIAITLIALQYSGSRKSGGNLYEIITKSNKKYTSS